MVVKDAQILTYNEDMETGAYIKTWVGKPIPQSNYESAGQPRGGGWGTVTNILFENFVIHGAKIAAAITGSSGDNGTAAGTSLLEVSNIVFANFTGYTTGGKGNRTASVSCSKVKPCYNISFKNVSLASSEGGIEYPPQGTCTYNEIGGVRGLVGTGCT